MLIGRSRALVRRTMVHVAVTECNKNSKVVRRPGTEDLDSKNLRVCSYIRVSEGGGVCGGPRPCPLPFGPWFVGCRWPCGFGGRRVLLGWRWPSVRGCWPSVLGPRSVRAGVGCVVLVWCAASPGHPKRAWGWVGRGHRAGAPSAAVGPGAALVGVCGTCSRVRGPGSEGRGFRILLGPGVVSMQRVWSTPLGRGGQGLDRFTLDVL